MFEHNIFEDHSSRSKYDQRSKGRWIMGPGFGSRRELQSTSLTLIMALVVVGMPVAMTLMVMVTLIEKQNRSKRARAKRAAEKSSKSAKPVHASARHSCGKGKTPKANEEDFELVVIEEEQRRELEHRHQEKQEQVSAKAWRSWHNQKEQVQEQVSAKAWPSWHNQEEQVQEQVSAKAWPSCHNQEEQLVPVQTWPSWHWHHAEDQEQVSAQTRPSWHWHHEEDQEHQEPVPVETLWHWHHEEWPRTSFCAGMAGTAYSPDRSTSVGPSARGSGGRCGKSFWRCSWIGSVVGCAAQVQIQEGGETID